MPKAELCTNVGSQLASVDTADSSASVTPIEKGRSGQDSASSYLMWILRTVTCTLSMMRVKSELINESFFCVSSSDFSSVATFSNSERVSNSCFSVWRRSSSSASSMGMEASRGTARRDTFSISMRTGFPFRFDHGIVRVSWPRYPSFTSMGRRNLSSAERFKRKLRSLTSPLHMATFS